LGVSANDLDSDANAKLSFSVSGRDAANFEVDPNNGVVTVGRDFQQKISYQVRSCDAA
jgi:hypothetical protein